MWSIGNEIHERFSRPDLAQHLRQTVSSLDSTRPITAAICDTWDWPGQDWDKISTPPSSIWTSAATTTCPRKTIPTTPATRNGSWSAPSPPSDVFNGWTKPETYPYAIGQFVWTAIDYPGESGIGHTVLDNEKNGQLMPWRGSTPFAGPFTCAAS